MINPFCAARFIASGFTVIVAIMESITGRHAFTVSVASKIFSLSSCISLLYARGSPLRTVSSAIRSPKTRPVLPRISSAMSGFFFCGIIDEPVVYASDSSTKPNSQLDHSTSSSESLERCIIISEIADASSTQ